MTKLTIYTSSQMVCLVTIATPFLASGRATRSALDGVWLAQAWVATVAKGQHIGVVARELK